MTASIFSKIPATVFSGRQPYAWPASTPFATRAGEVVTNLPQAMLLLDNFELGTNVKLENRLPFIPSERVNRLLDFGDSGVFSSTDWFKNVRAGGQGASGEYILPRVHQLLTYAEAGYAEILARQNLAMASDAEMRFAKRKANKESKIEIPEEFDDFSARVALMKTIPSNDDFVGMFLAQAAGRAKKNPWVIDVAQWIREQREVGREVVWPVSEFLEAHNWKPPSKVETFAFSTLMKSAEWRQCAAQYDVSQTDNPLFHLIYTDEELLSVEDLLIDFRNRRETDRANLQAARDAEALLQTNKILSVPSTERRLLGYPNNTKRVLRSPPTEPEITFYDPHFGLEILTGAGGLLPPDYEDFAARASGVGGSVLLLLPGAGTAHSTAQSMIPAYQNSRYYLNGKDNQQRSERSLIALSHPFHGSSPEAWSFLGVQQYIDRILAIARPLAENGYKVNLQGRSTGANLALEIARSQSAQYFSSIVAISPQHPEWGLSVLDKIQKLVESGEYEINPNGLLWAISLDYKIDLDNWRYNPDDWNGNAARWFADFVAHLRANPELFKSQWNFHKQDWRASVKTLLIAGQRDQEYQDGFWKSWQTYGLVTGVDVHVSPTAPHNPYTMSDSGYNMADRQVTLEKISQVII